MLLEKATWNWVEKKPPELKPDTVNAEVPLRHTRIKRADIFIQQINACRRQTFRIPSNP